MSFAMPECEFPTTDHEPLAFLDFPSQLKLDFLGLDMSPTHVDHVAMHGSESSPTMTAPTAAVTTHSGRSTRGAPVSEADQRAKNRLIVKRCYYKKIVRTKTFVATVMRVERCLD